ncbi:MAG: hypothetical protein KC466_19820, partial [Myxococcales bacterium]|nr:hypothetical protein [Myxococcales bacterium]
MGDMNFDGVPDIAVANWGYDGQLGEDSGRIWRVSGADGTLSPPTDGGAGDRLGYAFDSIGDVNGDGAADLVVSATGANWGAGAAYVLDGATGIRIRSHPGGFDGFGWAVAGGADVDGDSVRDYAVGAPGFASGTGRVMVFSGATGHSIYFFTDPIARAFGLSLSFVDDADGDGVADLMVGAPDTFPQCFDYPPFCGEFLPCEEICASIGAAYLYSGATGRAIHKWIGTSEERLGWFVGGSADTNGDGMSEVLIRNLNPYSFRYGRPVAENSTKIWSYSAPGACADFDGDGYGGANGTEGCAGSGIDCDDGDPAVNPGAVEVAGNFKDDNCNGLVD